MPDGRQQGSAGPAANQNNRFERVHDAIVIDGGEALVTEAGSTPVTWNRQAGMADAMHMLHCSDIEPASGRQPLID
ncbi:hypothetical protein NKJ26_13195 [Mesorhizobium sp. M0152]|uniref:hypothetical protein n=1 Tax=Mesorhizobium sp. M0152 TaxID=2956898 RepID=UPI003336C801